MKIIFLKIFWQESQNGCNGLFYLIIKILRGTWTKTVVKRVYVDPQGEMTNGENNWVRSEVMQETSSPKLGQDSLWIPKEHEAHKWQSLRKNTIQ